MDAAGNAVIAYTSMDMSASPYEFDVWVRLFSSDGVALGEPFRPHESAAEEQSTPQIAVAASGHFVIMWTHHAGCCDYDLWLREFDASGVATGSEQLAAQYGGAGGALATNSGERFLAVWSDYQGEGMHLFGRYFRSDTADTETVLTPTNDAFINLRRARGNFGAKSVLKVKDAAADFHTYIKFNAARVTAPVQSATLRLYVTNGGPDGGDIYAVSSYYDGTQELWLEEHLTPRNAPPITGKSIASLGRVRPGWVEVDVTAAVNQGLTKDAGRVSFGIRNASRNLVAFSSKEGAHAPELVITTEP